MASALRRAAAAVTSITSRNRRTRYQSLPTGGQEDLEDGHDTSNDRIRKTAARRRRIRRDLIIFPLAVIGVCFLAYWVVR